jgi:hypothetical protein
MSTEDTSRQVCPYHGAVAFDGTGPTAICSSCVAEGRTDQHPEGLLHVYGQRSWHEEAYIIGDERALRLLRDAIDRALAAPDGLARASVSVCDGEGYEMHVVKLASERMGRLQLPYTSYDTYNENKRRPPYSLVKNGHRHDEEPVLDDEEWFRCVARFASL